MIATTSDLQFGDLSSDIKAPNMLSYTANVVISVPTGHSVVPYATGGVGGLTMFERPELGVRERRDVSDRQCRRRHEVVRAEPAAGASAATIASRRPSPRMTRPRSSAARPVTPIASTAASSSTPGDKSHFSNCQAVPTDRRRGRYARCSLFGSQTCARCLCSRWPRHRFWLRLLKNHRPAPV